MSYSIPLEEKDFLKAMSFANTSTNEEEDKKKKLYEQLDEIISKKTEDENANNNGFKKIEYSPFSDDEIKEIAKNIYDSKYSNELQKYLEDYKEKSEKTALQKEELSKKSEIDNANINKNYEASKTNSENQALKRGLGRSSVIMNLLQQYEENKNSKLSENAKSLNDSIQEIDKQLLELEDEKTSTKNNLEMEKSIEIAKKITDLKKERDDKIQEVTDFNNGVNEKILKYSSDKSSSDLTDEKQQKNNNIEKAKTILSYYNNFTAKEAFEDFSNDTNFKNYLGEYYNEFYQLLKAKAQNSDK